MDVTESQPAITVGEAPSRVRSLAEQHDLAWAWFAASLAGIVAISLIPDRLGPIRMLTPLVVMAIFVAFGLSRSRFSTPRLADSIYFMGFLWTLWALIDVLVFSEQLRAEQLYNAFGYALIATATGMFIRLALLQFYRTIDDQEDQAVDQVDQAVARLNTCVNALASELAHTQQAVAGLRTDGARMLQDWHQDFAVAARKPVAILAEAATDLDVESKHLADALKDVRAGLTPVTKTIKALDSRFADASKKLSDGMTQSSELLEGSLKRFHENLAKVEGTPETLEREICHVAASLHQALAPLDEASARILRDVDAAIVSLAKTLVTLPDEPRIREVTAKLANGLEALCESSRTLATVAATAGGGLKQAGEQAEAFTGAIATARGEIGRGVSELAQQTQQLRDSLSEAGRDTREVDAVLRQVVTFVRSELARQ